MEYNYKPENNIGQAKHWFALYTKPRHEFTAAEHLSDVSIEYYLPTVVKIKQWSDRKKKIIEPLIKGYIFIHSTEKERIVALQQRGIVSCVFFNGRPATIPNWQIDNLRLMLETESEFQITDQIEAGTKVKIISGPFEGVLGVVNETTNGKVLSITIDLLKRSVTAILPAESVIKVVDEEPEKKNKEFEE
ncbi:MAG: UpxY family transcription antiterminator [Bacteroidota bacterium]|jgi:transcription antitermination factor NusG|nr:UpxY family transcription antiterminator [Ignavibacteria bacterium]MCU7500931.1 UpxY family transcription antiterminator [Ignavibacteria bacterium]MCU7519640.1 UpxY family transcription antiterminator [Ignavibacteria bacterium]MCU7525488.1 UpxY family transcription antiterminator [Ignavibacteria bacterium]